MSAFNSITPFESGISQPSDAGDAEPPSSLIGSLHQRRLVSGAVMPFRRKTLALHPPVLSRFSPWLFPVVYPLMRYGVVPTYFSQVEVVGRENLPLDGPVILAPTHRSRWDAVLVPFAAGHYVTGRHLRFMVSANEVRGLQGWFIRRLGGFPVDTLRPAIATLRHGVEVLQQSETLVIFPEGDIFRQKQVQPLKQGLARLALQAEISQPTLGVRIVPISMHYSQPQVPWRCRVRISIGSPLEVADYCDRTVKQNAQRLTADLYDSLNRLMLP